jgi:hypothetical protein
MTDTAAPYCVATVIRPLDPPREEIKELRSFEEVVAHLRATHAWFADFMADLRAEGEARGDVPVGGFGVELRNRWGGEVEVGVGRDIWFLFQSRPEPARCYSDRPPLDGYLAFWLDGWHYTELARGMLVSRQACLAALRRWLETGAFPESGSAEQGAASDRPRD